MRAETILGRGLVTPIRRQGRDYAYAEGSERVEARVRQIMMTKKGELRWNPRFGVNLDRIRHRNITGTLIPEVQAELSNGLLMWERQIEILELSVTKQTQDGTTLLVRVVWRALSRGAQRNAVLTDPQTTEVRL